MKKPYPLPFIIVSIFMWIYCPSLAQPAKAPTSVLSPNAASLGLYGSVPVSLYTGVPNIEIPLYELDCFGFKLPISLRYHASGVRLDQRPGWVGLGWSLNAGGVITRNIKDVPDDYDNAERGYSRIGYYYDQQVLNTPLWNDRNYLRSVAQNHKRDTEPDEFSFNFLDYSGKFYRTHTGEWAVQCNKPVKVDFNGQFSEIPFNKTATYAENYGHTTSFNGFTITGEDGTLYLFGGNTDNIEYSIDFFLQYAADWRTIAWYLAKIILPNKQEITFNYERGDFISQMYLAVNNTIESWAESSGGFFKLSCSSTEFRPIKKSYRGQMIAPSYLKEIKANGNIVTFSRIQSTELDYYRPIYYDSWNPIHPSFYDRINLRSLPYSPSIYDPCFPILQLVNSTTFPECMDNLKWYKLDKITIKDNSNTEIKRIDLGYNNSPNQRLMLLNVAESGKNPYQFEYNTPGVLPGYLSNKTDHWGFYNGTYAPIDNPANYYSYRDPKPFTFYFKEGTIKKITYPTGGYTEFEFEPHQYRKQVKLNRWEGWDDLGSNKIAGGIRVKKISDFSSTGVKASSKEYFYVSDYLEDKTNANISSGVLGGQVQYYFKDYTAYAYNDTNVRIKMSIFSSVSVLPSCQNISGSHIGYTDVIEKREDGAFSKYTFTNFDNGHLDQPADAIIQESRTAYEQYASKEQERGKMIEQKDYSSDGKIVKSRVIEYEMDNASSTNYVRAMSAKGFPVCPESPDIRIFYDEGTSYKIYTYSMRPKSETETYYHKPTSQGNFINFNTVTNTVKYAYNKQKLLQSQTTTGSDGATHSINYKYPADYTGTPYQEMVTANMLSPVVLKSVYRDGMPISEQSSDYALLHSRFYKPLNLKLRQDNILPAEIRETYMYDDFGNIREIRKDNSETTVYLWGYNYQYPIAEIKGVTYDEVKTAISGGETSIQSLASSTSPDMNKVENLRNAVSLSKALITTYKFRPLVGLEYMITPSGVKTEYEYDSFGRLTKIKHDGQTINTYQYNYGLINPQGTK